MTDNDIRLVVVDHDHVLDIAKLVTALVIELHLVDLRGRHRLALTLSRRGRLGRSCRVLTCRLLVGLGPVLGIARLHLFVVDLRLARHAVLHLRLPGLLEMHLRLLSLFHTDIGLLARLELDLGLFALDLDLRLLLRLLHLDLRLRLVHSHLRLGHGYLHLGIRHAHRDLRLGLLDRDGRGRHAHRDLWLRLAHAYLGLRLLYGDLRRGLLYAHGRRRLLNDDAASLLALLTRLVLLGRGLRHALDHLEVLLQNRQRVLGELLQVRIVTVPSIVLEKINRFLMPLQLHVRVELIELAPVRLLELLEVLLMLLVKGVRRLNFRLLFRYA